VSRTHWRSLDALEGGPEARTFREREFPEGAADPPDAISRRHVLTLLGASASLAGLAACRRPEERIVPYVEAPEQVIPGVPKRYATTLPAGTSAYGLVVESHEGRPTKIEGNELHPASLGSSSARVQAAMLDLYDPDRSPAVLRRGKPADWAGFVAFWGERARAHAADSGEGLAVLVPPFSSPTLSRLLGAFRQTYPRAQVVVHAPVDERNAHEGVARAAGRTLLPTYHFERAKAILAIDADFLQADPEMVRHTRGYAAGRRVATPQDEMSRLWAVEALLSVTGANADHRLRLRARLIPAFTAQLLSELRRAGVEVEAPAEATPVPGLDPRFLRALARDLADHRGQSLVLAGPRQPASLHAAVLALNAALGNLGRTVEYHEPRDAELPSRDGLGSLVAQMRAGRVKTLVVLGGNPAYDAPADLAFPEAASKVEELIHLGSHVDETAALASWQLPLAHCLESWDDARASCGTLSVVQPLVLPLFGGKTRIELVSLLAGGQDRPGYDLVRETWQPLLGEPFEKRWRRVLHDGLLPDSALPAAAFQTARGLADALQKDAAALAAGPGDGDLVFLACPKLHDGASANNAWLQELPDAITKVTWDNPLLLSPAEAQARGLRDQDVVRVEAGGRSLELPVMRVPGMADGTFALLLGYGRRAAGRVGTGVGFDAYGLRTSAALDLATGVRVQPTGRRALVAQTQEHGSMEGRAIVREATLERYRREPKFAEESGQPLFQLWQAHEYKARPQWGMVIDLNACTGCNACAVACQSENNVPVVGKDQVRRGREMAWLRVDRYFTGEPADASAVFQPVPCMQCENAPCEQVCPVGATVHDGEGLNVMVYNRCIGTRYCSNNCPYKVRRFNFFNYTKDTPELVKLGNNPNVTVRARGVMEKCTYCVQRLNTAKIDARLAGRELEDGDVRTACQQACPAEAIRFGDLLLPGSRVAQARSEPRTYALLEELNSRPRTTYQARLRNPHPDLAKAEGTASGEHDHA
jgi:molybdopterin-containing oxidoreductase family iron-sulfur binding subunit